MSETLEQWIANNCEAGDALSLVLLPDGNLLLANSSKNIGYILDGGGNVE